MLISIPVSLGELVDKITILRIKARHLQGDALAHVEQELELLQQALVATGVTLEPSLESQLLEVNRQLWEIEDAIRDQERQRCFEQAFVDLARAVYRTNDRRAALKREINERYGSTLIEQKSYGVY
jgi:predicted  nucleic acid-binding Zn-ribbon protein